MTQEGEREACAMMDEAVKIKSVPITKSFICISFRYIHLYAAYSVSGCVFWPM